MALEQYRERVRDAILQRTGEVFLNADIDHAGVIVQEAFNGARSAIKILSSRLDPSCYARGTLVESAKVFMADPDHSTHVLVESPLFDPERNFRWDQHPLVSALSGNENFEIRSVPLEWINKYKFNFLLMDDYGFRFEEDRSRAAAVAAFLPAESDKKQVKNLTSIFDRLWGVSQAIQVAAKR
jgi:hypothetical protein